MHTKIEKSSAIFLFLLLAGIFLCRPAVSQQNCPTETKCSAEQKEQQQKITAVPETVVVTATRTEQNLTDVPGSISVVTEKDIETRKAFAVDDVLGSMPGIFQGRADVSDYNPEVAIRGIAGARRALFLMDGITLNHPQFGSLLGFGALEPEAIGSIEVVEGPFSSLYGGTAMAGVVNITSKMPSERELIVKSGYGSSWNRGTADDDLRKDYISFGDGLGNKLRYFMSYGRTDTNGFPNIDSIVYYQPPAGVTGYKQTRDEFGNTAYLIGDLGDATWGSNSITAKAKYNISKTSNLSIVYLESRFRQHYDAPHTYLKDALGNSVWSYTNVPVADFFGFQNFHQHANNGKLGYQTQIRRVKADLSFFYTNITEGHELPGNVTLTGGPGFWWNHPINQRYQADALFTTGLSSKQVLTFGASFQHNAGRSTEYLLNNWMDHSSVYDTNAIMEGADRTYAFFAQDEVILRKNLIAYLGLREDVWEAYGGKIIQKDENNLFETYKADTVGSFSPKAAVVYTPISGTTVRASVGRTFRPPTVYDMYSRWYSPGATGYTLAGNPGLKPENATSWDLGVEQTIPMHTTLKATYFENYLSDYIYRAMLSTSPVFEENENAGNAVSRGVEFEANQATTDWLKLFTNVTWLKSKITKNAFNPAIVGKKMLDDPDLLFNAGATATYRPFTATLNGKYVAKSYGYDDNSDRVNNVQGSCDPYFVADLNASYGFAKLYRISFFVKNLLDRRYFYTTDNALNFKAAGRSWYGEVRFKL